MRSAPHYHKQSLAKSGTSAGSQGSVLAKKKSGSSASGGVGRTRVFLALLFIGGGAVIFRLFFLQVLSHDKWVALAQGQHNASLELSADRGEIYMHDGDTGRYPLAVNREYQMVYVVPKDITEKDSAAFELARVLGIDATEVRDKINRPNDPFEILKKRLTEDEVSQIQQLHLQGVALLPEKYRYYPAGELAAQVIGFASLGEKGGAGGYGIEASFDAQLRGQTGTLSQEKDASGRWIPLTDRVITHAEDGDSMVLTLDRVIQYETEKILKDSVERYQADRATAIVMDPQTGNILSMASSPQFDPNTYSKEEDYSVFLNPAVSSAYEPGSIMKPISMAIGIEEGKVSPTTEYVDPGSVVEAGYTIRNAEDKVYGRSTMYKVLDESINTGMIFVEKLVGNKLFGDYLHRFGFGERTGVSLPAELPGNLKNLVNDRGTINFYTASFGQGITSTPIQMVAAYAALANGGRLLKPNIVDYVVHEDGTEEHYQPTIIRRVISEETSKAMGLMLRSVVVNGHGKRGDVPGYLVGGKTGTAQVAKTGAKGYQDGLSIGSFVGYAPINDPQFVVMVKLDNPKNVEWAESSAAPTFGQIMKFLLEYAKVKPTEETVKK
ncbi:MAG: penicillin-binding protein 2 [Candidatus Moranbacteria bacterium]|nr:penicillin-binding protein 2 [Candidatus Moranbacteria bacterium]